MFFNVVFIKKKKAILLKRIKIVSALRYQTVKRFYFFLKGVSLYSLLHDCLITSEMRLSGVFLQILLLTVRMWSSLIL